MGHTIYFRAVSIDSLAFSLPPEAACAGSKNTPEAALLILRLLIAMQVPQPMDAEDFRYACEGGGIDAYNVSTSAHVCSMGEESGRRRRLALGEESGR